MGDEDVAAGMVTVVPAAWCGPNSLIMPCDASVHEHIILDSCTHSMTAHISTADRQHFSNRIINSYFRIYFVDLVQGLRQLSTHYYTRSSS